MTDVIPRGSTSQRRPWLLVLLLVLAPFAGCGHRDPTSTVPEPSGDAEGSTSIAEQQIGDPIAQAEAAPGRGPSEASSVERADSLIESGNFAGAEQVLMNLTLLDPDDVMVLFRLANVKAAQGRLSEAVEILEAIPDDDAQASLPALGQAGDWCMELGRFDESEKKYLQILRILPDAVPAHRQLAYLYNRQGRRHEAAVHVRRLCQLGDIQQDELQSLIVLSDAMYDEPGSMAEDDGRPYWPIGNLAIARRLVNQRRYDEAVEQLKNDVKRERVLPAAMAFYGRCAVEAQNVSEFQWWLEKTDETTREFADFWAAFGTYLVSEHRHQEAVRALCEALERDPTDLISRGRLYQALMVLGKEDFAKAQQQQWLTTRDTLNANNRINGTPAEKADAIAELAENLLLLHRNLEAVLWKTVEGTLRNVPKETFQALNQQRLSLIQSGRLYPSNEQSLCGLDSSAFPLPDVRGTIDLGSQSLADFHISADPDSLSEPSLSETITVRMENVAQDVGLDHRFSVASRPQPTGFALYQILGSAVVAFDYDLDGAVDLYLGQGGSDPPAFTGEQSNQLYRNVDLRLREVSDPSSTTNFRYTTGVTSGDWNQDGFADLVVCNLGVSYLHLNNGDGTFSRSTLEQQSNVTRVPSSVAMADLTGDSLPDIWRVAYVDDSNMAQKPDRNADGGVTKALIPTEFSPGKDRGFANDGNGGWSSFGGESDSLKASSFKASNGLGVVVSDFDGQPGNEIFVGNDLFPNQLWKRKGDSWSDGALLLGCGFGYTGRATASMGIAVGDFDRSLTQDIHITNYQQEASNLYLHRNGAYQDRNLQYKLNRPSIAVLGFGTQSVDVDNDGWLDLVVANGHVDKEADSKVPFEQPPQLFRNLGQNFELAKVEDPSGYWNSNHLGRGLARFDFNRDGRSDHVVTHLEAPTALLLNQTATSNHWLQIQLIGTQCERDAIGAKVTLRAGNRQLAGWVTAGDGFMSRNEAIVCFGLGDSVRVDEISIRWPDGREQRHENLGVDQRVLIIQSDRNVHAF